MWDDIDQIKSRYPAAIGGMAVNYDAHLNFVNKISFTIPRTCMYIRACIIYIIFAIGRNLRVDTLAKIPRVAKRGPPPLAQPHTHNITSMHAEKKGNIRWS